MTDTNRERKQILCGIVICFFLSGATGLVYEVLWTRMLGLIFGHTVFAITTVLAAFMAGLGLGSFLVGRTGNWRPRPLMLYAILEGGIGVSCLLVPLLMFPVESLYLALARAFELSFFTFSFAQFVLVFVLLLVPTTLMGATLPVLSHFFVTDEGTLGQRVGLLYALNTFGAVLGTALAGYFLLPAFGTRGTLYLAAALNIGIGALVIVFDLHLRRLEAYAGPRPVQARPQAPVVTASPSGVASWATRLVVIGFALSGAASMVYEVAWSRALSLILGSSTYAFTAMLLAFLIGIALGSALFAKLRGDRASDPLTFGLVQVGIAVAALVTLPVLGKLPEIVLRALAISLAPGFVLAVQVVLSVAAMIVPTLLIGASFPAAVKVAAGRVNRVARDVGTLYAVNTLGAIVGTCTAGFLLIPTLGVQATVKTAILLNLAIGAAITLASTATAARLRIGVTAAAITVVLAGVVWVPPWNASVMSSGVSIYAPRYHSLGRQDLARTFPRLRVVSYEDGFSATVTVHRDDAHHYLRVNGKTDASTGDDMHTQLMSAHIPLLLHPDPKNVLVIGLGSGVTVGAVAQHPVQRIDVVEIEPAVVRASRFFERENRNALRDPRVHLVIGDGRNFLLATAHRYDVIISEPSNPWIGGLAALFSKEFFHLARQRLSPDGIMLQWVQGYGLLPSDLKMVVTTFRTAFPATTIWHATGGGDFLLAGRQRVQPIDLKRIETAYANSTVIREDFQRVGLRSSSAMLADFLLAEPDAERYTLDGGVNTDDLLPLEFSAPRSLHLDTLAINFRSIVGFKTMEFPAMAPDDRRKLDTAAVRYDLALAYLRKGMRPEATLQLEKALQREPGHLASKLEMGKIQAASNLFLKAAETFQAVLARDPNNAEAYLQLGQIYQAQQLPQEALRFVRKASGLKRDDPTYQAVLAQLLLSQGMYEEAVQRLRVLHRQRPSDTQILHALGFGYLRQGRRGEAIQALEQAVLQQPENAVFYHHLGEAYLAANRPREAVATLRQAIGWNPSAPQVHISLGYAYMALGEPGGARESFEQALALGGDFSGRARPGTP